MPQYAFEAFAPSGEQIRGTLDASTRGDAYRQIESRHLTPIEVTEKTAAPKASPRNGNGTNGKISHVETASSPAHSSERGPKLKRAKLIFFTTELADLLDAGLPVQQALNVMAEKQQDAVIRNVGARIRHELREGQTLSVSFRQASPSFDDLYISVIAAGEASGTLPGVLHRMAQSMSQLHECSAVLSRQWFIPRS
jgi:type II secretory pathway component PulF